LTYLPARLLGRSVGCDFLSVALWFWMQQ